MQKQYKQYKRLYAALNANKSTFDNSWSVPSLNKKIPFHFLRIFAEKMYFGPLVHIWMSSRSNLWFGKEKAWFRIRTRPQMIQSLWS